MNEEFREWLNKCPLLFNIQEEDDLNIVIGFYKDSEETENE